MNNLKVAIYATVMLLFSCAAPKKSSIPDSVPETVAMAGTFRSATIQSQIKENMAATPYDEQAAAGVKDAPQGSVEETVEKDAAIAPVAAVTSTKKARSFAQIKQMVKDGSITMSKSDQKVLNKLDKLAQKNQAPLRENPFELTTLAKIIFGIGAAALLIYLFGGGLFFLFLFLVGLGAFLCRWIQIIDF